VSREEEIKHTQVLMQNRSTFDENSEKLNNWLKETSSFIAEERYPEMDHPFIIRHLLIDEALDYYQAHEDIIFNFYDSRKLLSMKQNILSQLRTVLMLDSMEIMNLSKMISILTSIRILTGATSVAEPFA
jgi:hypothetical protein